MKSYLKQIFHTQLFSLLNIVAGFATVLILVKSLEKTEYAEYVLIQGFIGICGMFLSQNLYAFTRMHIPGASLEVQYGLLKTVLIVVLASYASLVLLIELLNLDKGAWRLLEIRHDLRLQILTMLAFELLNSEIMRYYIAVKKVFFKNYAQLFQRVAVLVSSCALVLMPTFHLGDFLKLYIFGQLVVTLFLIKNINLTTFIKSKFSMVVIKKGYSVALPLLPSGLMSYALNYTDTLMISKYINKDFTAQYGFASQIIMIAMMMIGGSIVLTMFPYATQAHNEAEFDVRTYYFIRMMNLGLCFSILFYYFIVINSHTLISLLGLKQYKSVPAYLNILAIFPLVQFIYNVCSHHLQLHNVFKFQVYIALFVILENAVLNYIFIKSFGVMGAALASLLSFLTLSCLYLYVSLRKEPSLLKAFCSVLNPTIVYVAATMLIVAVLFSYFEYNKYFKIVMAVDIVTFICAYKLIFQLIKKAKK